MKMKLKKLTFVTMSAMLSTALLFGCAEEDEENPEDPATEEPATEDADEDETTDEG
jgi:hypothetical protein